MNNHILTELGQRYPKLEPIMENINAAYRIISDTYRSGGKLFICGNGGSCADSEHIVGELMKSFNFKRGIDDNLKIKLQNSDEYGKYLAEKLEGALPAISLTGSPAFSTAYVNDTAAETVYAQQLYGLGRKGDALIVLTTSGNSVNCIYTAHLAKIMEISVIAMTGENGGKIASMCDVLINVPEKETFRVQELHLPIYHTLCAMVEAEFFVEERAF